MKIVSNHLSPNLGIVDLWGSLWQKNSDEIIEQKICSTNYILLNAARSGLGLLAQHLDLPKQKKIGIPAFSCVVMATPFLTAGYEIEWLETDENGLIDIVDFESKAAGLSLVLIPHIWGQEAPVEACVVMAQAHEIVTVEDCAHLWSAGPLVADFRLYSFGREKVMSCVSGGALCQKKSRSDFNLGCGFVRDRVLNPAGFVWSIRHWTQPLVFSLSLFWWFRGGKYLAGLFSKLGWLPRAVTPQEKVGKEDFKIECMPFLQKKLLAFQIENVDKKQLHADKMSKSWAAVLSKSFPQSKVIIPKNSFRVILKTGIKLKILQKAALKGFVLEEWNGVPLSPKVQDMEVFGYKKGQCPQAEVFAKTYLTFPTNIRTSMADIKRFEKIIFSTNLD